MDFNVPKNFKGLTEAEIQISREKFGFNPLKKTEKTLTTLLSTKQLLKLMTV